MTIVRKCAICIKARVQTCAVILVSDERRRLAICTLHDTITPFVRSKGSTPRTKMTELDRQRY